MMNLRLLFFFTCLVLNIPIALAQSSKESNSDLREFSSKFLVEVHHDKSMYELRENNNSYTLHFEIEGKGPKKKRLSVEEAEKIDQNFVSKFIDLKYTHPDFDGKKCDIVMKFVLRSESTQICKGENKKLSLAKNIISELDKIF